MLRVDDPRRRKSFVVEEKPRRRNKLFLPLVLMGAALVGASLLVVNFYPFSGGESPEVEEAKPEDFSAAGFDFVADEQNRKILHLKPPFRANLSGLNGRYVVLVKVWLEVDSLDVAKELNEDHAKFRRMTDDILQTIRSWTYAELTYGNGTDRLKDQLRDHVNRYIARGKVLRVLFPEIVFDEILPRPAPQ